MSNASLAAFEADLRRLIGAPAIARPFVCDGSPLECRAVLVGSNPADAAGLDFWRFWDPGEGFRLAEWRAARAGKTDSTARRILDRIEAAAAPVRVLETNVDPKHAGVVGFLLAATCPAVVVAHGTAAAAHLRRALLADLPADRFARVAVSWGTVHLRAVPHLARRWSYDAAAALGREIREITGGSS